MLLVLSCIIRIDRYTFGGLYVEGTILRGPGVAIVLSISGRYLIGAMVAYFVVRRKKQRSLRPEIAIRKRKLYWALLGCIIGVMLIVLLVTSPAVKAWYLVGSLEHASCCQQYEYEELKRIGTAAVPALVRKGLKAPDSNTRLICIGLLSEIGDPRAVPYLRQVLISEEEDSATRVNTAWGIHRIVGEGGAAEGLSYLRQIVVSEEEAYWTRRQAAQAIYEITGALPAGWEDSKDFFLPILKSE